MRVVKTLSLKHAITDISQTRLVARHLPKGALLNLDASLAMDSTDDACLKDF
jgi:hypothetical protein